MDGKRTLAEAIYDATKSGLVVRISSKASWAQTIFELQTSYHSGANFFVRRSVDHGMLRYDLSDPSALDRIFASTIEQAVEQIRKDISGVTNDQQP